MAKRKPFGYHLTLDLYECDPEATDSISVCYEYLDNLVDVIGTNRQSPPFVVRTDGEKYPDKAGISGWIPVVESGFSIHTLTPTRFISIDIYSCKKFDLDEVIEYTKNIFKPQKIEKNYFLRGEEYMPPEIDGQER